MVTTQTKKQDKMAIFMQLADKEYNDLANYCNSMSSLSHSLSTTTTTENVQQQSTIFDLTDASTNTTNYRQTLKQRLRPAYLDHHVAPDPKEDALMDYADALEKLRSSHQELVGHYQIIVTDTSNINSTNDADENDHCSNSAHQIATMMNNELLELLSEHVQLSSRVIKTCCSSSTTKGYGPLHDYGLLKNLIGSTSSSSSLDSGDDWQEVRTIALTALKASIARLKRNMER